MKRWAAVRRHETLAIGVFLMLLSLAFMGVPFGLAMGGAFASCLGYAIGYRELAKRWPAAWPSWSRAVLSVIALSLVAPFAAASSLIVLQAIAFYYRLGPCGLS